MGGGMFDVGVYPTAYVNQLMSCKIVEKNRLTHINQQGSDDFSLITLRYENGVIVSLRGAIGLNTENKAFIYGTKGKIIVSDYWKASKATLYNYDGQEVDFEVEQPSEFTYQIQEVIDCINAGKTQSDIMGYEASLQLLDVVGY
jgi:predicted dehydrogenase